MSMRISVYYVLGAKHIKLHKQQTFDIIRRITLFANNTRNIS